MRKFTLAANWKMNGSLHSINAYFSEFKERLDPSILQDQVDLIFAVPFTLLAKVGELLKDTPLKVAAQNAHWKEHGAYTGEVSFPMLAEIGVSSVIIAHSERRQYFNETNTTAAYKVKAALAHGIIPILCVGETLAERQGEETEEVISEQLTSVFKEIHQIDKLIIAYEPVWAIGTGLAASAEQAGKVHSFIRQLATQKFGNKNADELSILYGGSMKPENTTELLSQEDVDGGLIGGASLKPDSFADMVEKALALQQA